MKMSGMMVPMLFLFKACFKFRKVALAALLVLPPAARADMVSEVELRYQRRLDEAIDRGLDFLHDAQDASGRFGRVVPATSTALAVMAFMVKGHTPGLGPYDETINRGIDFVLASQQPNGYLAPDGRMYGHNIATLMLSQVSGMLDPERQERVDKALAGALKLTLSAQQVSKSARDQGGWRYSPTSTDSDMSHTGWAFMALLSARNAGAAVPYEAIDAALDYILRCYHPRHGGFAYRAGGAGDRIAMTGAALLCLMLAGTEDEIERFPERTGGRGMSHAQITESTGTLLLRHGIKPDVVGAYGARIYYAAYHCAQAMFQLGGEHWEKYAPALYEMLLARQEADGSFKTDTDAGGIYATAMAILSLGPSYRQLPIYQR